MKDVHTPLREFFVAKLATKGLTSYENGAVPDEAVTPYVIISSMDATENSNKSDFGHLVNTLLDFVTSYPKNKAGSSKAVDVMAGQALDVINSKTIYPAFGGLQIVNTKILQDQKLGDKTPTKTIFRRINIDELEERLMRLIMDSDLNYHETLGLLEHIKIELHRITTEEICNNMDFKNG